MEIINTKSVTNAVQGLNGIDYRIEYTVESGKLTRVYINCFLAKQDETSPAIATASFENGVLSFYFYNVPITDIANFNYVTSVSAACYDILNTIVAGLVEPPVEEPESNPETEGDSEEGEELPSNK